MREYLLVAVDLGLGVTLVLLFFAAMKRIKNWAIPYVAKLFLGFCLCGLTVAIGITLGRLLGDPALNLFWKLNGLGPIGR